MIPKPVRFLARLTILGILRSAGFLTAMAVGPGLLLVMYLFEPHRPLPGILDDLPYEEMRASNVLSGRIDTRFRAGDAVVELTDFLEELDFEIDPVDNNATYARRQFLCMETYTIVWTEAGKVLRNTAGLYEKTCSGFEK